MTRSSSPLDRFLERTLGNMLKQTDPGRLGWAFVALALALGFLGVVRAASSTDELLSYLAMLSFISSIAFAEPQIPWPPTVRKPAAVSMFALATGLAVTWGITTPMPRSFSLMGLLFAFAMTLRELKRLLTLF